MHQSNLPPAELIKTQPIIIEREMKVERLVEIVFIYHSRAKAYYEYYLERPPHRAVLLVVWADL